MKVYITFTELFVSLLLLNISVHSSVSINNFFVMIHLDKAKALKLLAQLVCFYGPIPVMEATHTFSLLFDQ